MAWIKRNLYFVITLVVGLGVTGFCGYLVFSTLNQNKADSDQYASDKSSLEALQKKVPYPDPQNIQAAEADAERVRDFLGEFHKPFANFPPPPVLDDRQFKDHLQRTIFQFATEATNAGVGLPPGYAFSFSQQMNVLNYASESIAPWMQQLTEIRAILQILYKAKINYLQQVKRQPVAGEQIMGDDYLLVATVSNNWEVVTPYMVSFRGFSADIANVLAGIAASSNCLIVETVHVEPSREPLPQLQDLLQPVAPAPMPAPYRFRPPQEIPGYSNPYINQGGRGGRFNPREPRMMMPQMQQYAPVNQAPEPAGPVGPVTILTETPLFVTIYINVVKLKAPEAPPPKVSATTRPMRRERR